MLITYPSQSHHFGLTQVLQIKKEEEEKKKREEGEERARMLKEQERVRKDRDREMRLRARQDEEVLRASAHVHQRSITQPAGCQGVALTMPR